MQLAIDRKLPDITYAQVDMLAHVSGNNLAVLDKLLHIANGNTQTIPSLLHRLKFRPIRELSCTSQYHYPSMDIPMHLCFQMVDERINVAFENWTVFQPSQWMSLDIVSLSWPIDLCGFETDAEVEGMVIQDLRQLVYNSLLDQSAKTSRILNQMKGCVLQNTPSGPFIPFAQQASRIHQVSENPQQYYAQNQENLRKIEKNVGVMLQKQKQNIQNDMSKCDQTAGYGNALRSLDLPFIDC
uniref:Uncharacterized protein n=1 Tax=Ditylenchus dipsaci TaxID=166011 RepID=A0A915E3N9_9BILA